MTALSLLAAILASGCQAAVIRAPGVLEDDEPPPPVVDPEAFFRANVEPILVAQCRVCHETTAASQGTVFLAPGGDYYASIWSYREGRLLTPGDGAGSVLVRKVTVDPHLGPSVSEGEAALFRQWIDAEGMTTEPPPVMPPPVEPMRTGFYPVNEGANRMPLAEVGLSGAELVFTATRITGGIIMTDVVLVAGAGGLVVNHPRFIVRDDTTSMERYERDEFSSVTIRAPAGGTGRLVDRFVISPFPTVGSLAIEFDTVGPYTM
ncbi:MAG: hypothetical protein KF729_36040 [Sandaracinaceae bacterium]|nr:hypothetical protein [Sandaracinaceae bacterium]